MLGQTGLEPDESDSGEESMSVSTLLLDEAEHSSRTLAIAELFLERLGSSSFYSSCSVRKNSKIT